MKWFNNKIKSLFQEEFDKINYILGSLEDSLDRLEREVLLMQQDKDRIIGLYHSLESLNKINTLKLNESERILREEMELGISIITKRLDRKLEILGDRKGLVIDLMKRIAELEGDINVQS